MTPDPTASPSGEHDTARLLNGISLSGHDASRLTLDLADPMAVLALLLASDGAAKIRERTTARRALLQQAEDASGVVGLSSQLDTPEAVSARLRATTKQDLLEDPRLAGQIKACNAARFDLGLKNAPVETLLVERLSFSRALWWLGIGWIVWMISGKAAELRRLKEARDQARATADEADQRLAQLKTTVTAQRARECEVLAQVEASDRHPIALIPSFGWSHVPFDVVESTDGGGHLVFTSMWRPNVVQQLRDIPDGIAKVETLRREVMGPTDLPILLSPDTDDSPDARDLVGEELVLARNIDKFAALVDSALDVRLEATLLPADPAIDAQMNAWNTTASVSGADANWLAQPPARGPVGSVLETMERLEEEDRQPETSLERRLVSVATGLTDHNKRLASKRTEAVDALLSHVVKEWSGWTLLPMKRRYCPSFHRSKLYRYHRLGFTLDQAFDEQGRFAHADKLYRLPEPKNVERMVRLYEEERLNDRHSAAGYRQEIIDEIRRQVEGNTIIPLSPAAVLQYNLGRGEWQCGLCVHERRIGAPGSPEHHLGCPEGGRFKTDVPAEPCAETSMAEQYVHYGDLLVPMLSSLWHEKTTFDEANRIMREKEKELRDLIRDEQTALREETDVFKSAARDRLVQLEDLHGRAEELRARLSSEVGAAYALGALDAPRQRELLDELREFDSRLAAVTSIKTKVAVHEQELAEDVARTFERRHLVLEEPLRRGSDSPEFVLEVSRPVQASIEIRAGAPRLVPSRSSSGGGIFLRVRQDGKAEHWWSLHDIVAATDSPDGLGRVARCQGLDSERGTWVPLIEHPALRRLRPNLPTSTQALADSRMSDEPPPPPSDDAAFEPPPIDEQEEGL